MATENKRMVQLRDTSANWSGAAFVPLDGEWLLEEIADGSYRGKVGNGIDTYSSLPYFTGYSEADIIAIIDAHLAANYGIDVSTGAADAGRFVRLNSNGLVDNSMLPASAFKGWFSFKGGLDMINNPAPTSPDAGDAYQHTIGSGKYDESWDMHRGLTLPAGHGVEVSPYDFVFWSGNEWLLLDGNPRVSTAPDGTTPT